MDEQIVDQPTSLGKEKSNTVRNVLLLILLLAVAAGSAFFYIGDTNRRSPTPTPRTPIAPTPSAELPVLEQDPNSINTIIYGNKLTENAIMVSAVNDSTKNHTKISLIRETAKFIIPLSSKKHLLFIGDIDSGDKGASIKVKTIVPTGTEIDGQIKTLYTSSNGYKIDSVIISENNNWIAWSENKPVDPARDTHENNFFRSYKADITNLASRATLSPTLLLDEKSDTGVTIHMPAVITNSGVVYFNGIKPVGYFIHDGFKDEAKRVVLATNSYNSKPYLVNQRYLLYTSYEQNNNPKLLPGTSPSTRVEVINRNIVKISDLQNITNTPVVAAPGDDGEHYNHPIFVSGDPTGEFRIAVEVFKDNTGGEVTLQQKEIQVIKRSSSGVFEKQTLVTVPNGKSYRILSVGLLPNGRKTVIVGVETASIGSLGSGWFVANSGYQKMLSAIHVYEIDGGVQQILRDIPILPDSGEFLGILPKDTNEKIGIDRNESLDRLIPTVFPANIKDKLQLETFVPVPVRRRRTNSRADCENDWQALGYPNAEVCESCPIYVYNNSDELISIKPITRVIPGSTLPVIEGSSWNFRADSKGNLLFPDNTLHKRIDFLFPRSSITQPTYGKIVENKNFQKEFYSYAVALGFTNREATDAIEHYWFEVEDSPYIFISHLSENQTKQLLDFQVTPKPSVQETRIFYLKKLQKEPTQKPQPPIFSPMKREGLTVVTWGGVVE